MKEILEEFYKNEINLSISCFWDRGWELKIGDEINGWKLILNSFYLTEIEDFLNNECRKIFIEKKI